MTKKFLLLYRTPLSTEQYQPSPEEMQAVLAQWHQWKENFPSILDMGDGLLPTGRSVKAGVVTDGPNAESKEIISGYSIVAASDYDAALVVARACPVLFAPGASIEVRELAGYLARLMSEESQAIGLVLRHEYGRLVAALLREFGAHRLSMVEDGLAQAMLEGVVAWRTRGVPPNARAWLHRAARSRIIDELRRQRRVEAMDEHGEAVSDEDEPPLAGLSEDVHDDELRALFACAEPSIPVASQLVFALRTLCGFSTSEIACRLVTSEENVQKRWERARDRLQQVDLRLEITAAEWPARSDAVLRMIYVLFTEGYFASSGDQALRLDLCTEALRLGHLVAEHPRYTSSQALALVALMRLHHARRDARVDRSGLPVLLEEQDRRRYHRAELAMGLEALSAAARGGLDSKYHLEAAIAAEHAFAPTFEETRWSVIVSLYDRLAKVDPSPLHELHAAIALSYAEAPQVAIARLDQQRPPTWLFESYLWLATYADLHRRMGNHERACALYEQAIALATPLERATLERRLEACRLQGAQAHKA
jgi:RNA polymerase sigma factor (sigma-70 family)